VGIGPLAWSPAGDQLLIYARATGEPWTAGRLLRWRAEGSRFEPLPLQGIAPRLELRPERVPAAWLGSDPLIWGAPTTAPADGRADWYRVTADGPVALTAALEQPRRDRATVDAAGAVVLAGAGAWWIGRGEPRLIADHLTAAVPDGPVSDPRGPYAVPRESAWSGLRLSPSGSEVVLADVDGQALTLPAPDAVEVLAGAPERRGALVRVRMTGGAEQLQWLSASQPPRPLATINPNLADVDAPRVRAIRHTGPDGALLSSWLLLPSQAAARAPPLVVWPYLGSNLPTAPHDADLTDRGFNPWIALLVSHGYAVLLPSLPWRWTEGPEAAEGLAARILAPIDAAARDPDLAPEFDPDRLAIWGFSFGGWTTLMTITETQRFKAAIAGASMSDLVSVWGQFQSAWAEDPSEGLATFNTAGWVEDLQPGMHAPPFAEPARYLRNSPVFHAGVVTTPLLLLHGDQDSYGPGQPQEMFSALLRQDKDAQLVTYWGEGHTIHSPGNQRDMAGRVFAWLSAYVGDPSPSRRSRVAASPANPAPAAANAAPRTLPPRRSGDRPRRPAR
jgi:dipeptidyl aminopeptidase/acylaminoacyl peptidase